MVNNNHLSHMVDAYIYSLNNDEHINIYICIYVVDRGWLPWNIFSVVSEIDKRNQRSPIEDTILRWAIYIYMVCLFVLHIRQNFHMCF